MSVENQKTQAPDPAADAVRELIRMVDTGPILYFSELMRLVMDNGTNEQQKALLTKTNAITTYIAERRTQGMDYRRSEDDRIRKAYANREMNQAETLSDEELDDRIREQIGKMSRSDKKNLLGWIAGEHGLKCAQERRREKNA